MHLHTLIALLLSFLVSIVRSAPTDGNDGRDRYWETDINHDCGRVETGAKYQQVGAMQWGYPDSNGHLPFSYNTKVCLTKEPGYDCIRLSSAEDHKVNRFYLATGFFIAVYRYMFLGCRNNGDDVANFESDDNCMNDKVTVQGQSGSLFGEYNIHSYRAWAH
ncbi:uncharacterized protein N0V89_000011 [Didymosphaeria variabile]|uniref:Uncharacterized protein n=1 Tax=Didymosphaeria variabile TaxID=1932322 RepID=A0A9W8XTW3_9PLEO|nr:uncharacterized protein N0V89_000011 [Didymosphaeria variabile]KAJ4359458.1 hypothetical protein N0V89_000011 [Didymosphaeria variabile]